jgi:hypothetical protein
MTVTPHHNYPDKMMPLVHHHYCEVSKNFSSENITHYLRVIMFGCYNVATKNIIDTLASEGVTVGIQARSSEYLTAHNLFNNELLLVTIFRTALNMATTYSNYMGQTCNGGYSLIQVEDRTFYRNILLFIFTSQLLECARSKGINHNIDGDP